jgi:beta-D-xylosidase 4
MRPLLLFLLLLAEPVAVNSNLNPCFKGNPLMGNPCRKAGSNFSKLTYCNASAPIEERIADAISHMSIGEKIGALGTVWPATYSLGLDCYNWYTEATSGVAWAHCGSCKTTKFAFPITLAQAFNRSLWALTGRQIGREARALMNSGVEYSTFWAPVVNLAREPRWGRNLECPGEDPRLSGLYAASFVQGFQIAPEDPGHLQASACCKHFVANSMEHTHEADGEDEDRGSVKKETALFPRIRYLKTLIFNKTGSGQTCRGSSKQVPCVCLLKVDENITMRDMVDSYMPSFNDCVQKGNVSGLMCSYNSGA